MYLVGTRRKFKKNEWRTRTLRRVFGWSLYILSLVLFRFVCRYFFRWKLCNFVLILSSLSTCVLSSFRIIWLLFIFSSCEYISSMRRKVNLIILSSVDFFFFCFLFWFVCWRGSGVMGFWVSFNILSFVNIPLTMTPDWWQKYYVVLVGKLAKGST